MQTIGYKITPLVQWATHWPSLTLPPTRLYGFFYRSLCVSLTYTDGLSLSSSDSNSVYTWPHLFSGLSAICLIHAVPPFLLSPHTGAVTRSWHPILIACHRRKFSSRTTYRVKIFKRLMQSCCCSRLLKVLLFKLRLIMIDKKFEEILEEGQIGNFKVWRHK